MKINKALLPLPLAAALFLSACGTSGVLRSASADSQTSQATEEAVDEATDEAAQTASQASAAEMFTDRDLEIGYDEETSAYIALTGEGAACASDAVRISGSTVTITEEGSYVLSGTLSDGSIVVQAEDTDKVQLVLDGVDITSATSAAIYVLEADKVFITTVSGTENVLANGGEYVAIDDNNIDAVVFSKADLTLNGAGKLTVHAAAGHGIVSKDDLVLTSGTYSIAAADQGLSGKDSVRIASGTYVIASGKDGIHAENEEDSSLGFLYIAGGDFTIDADGDGMSASAYLQIEGGSFSITTGEGSASVSLSADSMNAGQRGGFGNETASAQEEDAVSQKGVKADGALTIAGGSFVKPIPWTIPSTRAETSSSPRANSSCAAAMTPYTRTRPFPSRTEALQSTTATRGSKACPSRFTTGPSPSIPWTTESTRRAARTAPALAAARRDRTASPPPRIASSPSMAASLPSSPRAIASTPMET